MFYGVFGPGSWGFGSPAPGFCMHLNGHLRAYGLFVRYGPLKAFFLFQPWASQGKPDSQPARQRSVWASHGQPRPARASQSQPGPKPR